MSITKISSNLNFQDHVGGIMVRWGINRSTYRVSPGIYSLGKPSQESPVLVTANYKLSFDALRKSLKNISAWILVLDTKGVNVWCAAGKGTFGTTELVHQIEITDLKNIVSHHKVILPQLGATGVAAHEVKRLSGFQVIYGPVNASDINAFLNNNFKTTKGMRDIQFKLWDRLVLTPIELVHSIIPMLILSIILSAISGFSNLLFNTTYLFIAVLSGTVITPMLLPWIPNRSFSLKGAIIGIITAIVTLIVFKPATTFLFIGWILMLTSISSFLAMNFTGSSTYTSISGVKKEMRIAIPLQIGFSLIGLILFIVNRFLNGG